ncbi:MAG: glycosyltransferase [Flavobacteriaceae bacterium]
MKILFLCDTLGKGGKERRMIELIKGLSKYPQLRIELLIFRNLIEYPEIYDLNVGLHIIERKYKYNPFTFLELLRKCKEIRPNIIHAWSSMTAILAIPSLAFVNAKLVNGCITNAPHNLSFLKKKYLLAKLSFPFSKIIVGNSEAGLKAYRAPKQKSLCIPNGFDFKRIEKLQDKERIRSKYQLDSNFIVGMVAGFDERKDYQTFISSAAEVLNGGKDVLFLAVGSGPNMEMIKEIVPETIKEKIIFTGRIDQVESLIDLFDIGVLCTNSRVHGEGISNAILEYMALGKPVIATKGGGTDEIVLSDRTGYLIPSKSPGALSNKILELLEQPQKAKEMGTLGKNRIKDQYSLEKMTTIYFDLYKKLINEESRSK